MLTWQRRASENPWRKSWPTERLEETRQQYATRKIQALQREHPKALSFKDLLDAFRWLGKHYDKGRDLEGVAA